MQRISVVVIGSVSTALALLVPSVYGMFIMAADIIFVIMFPQLVAAVFTSYSNSYGALSGYLVGILLRIGAGEPNVQLPAFIHFPLYSAEMGQLFPFRTFAMLCSLTIILCISKLTNWISSKCVSSINIQLEGGTTDISSKMPLKCEVDQREYITGEPLENATELSKVLQNGEMLGSHGGFVV